MKDIGTTDSGGFIVEMTRSEHETFSALCLAVKEHTDVWYKLRQSFPPGYLGILDLTETFTAIEEWINLKMNVNELRRVADQLDEAIGKKVK